MATLNKVLDTFAVVGDKVGFAHVFTGLGPDLGTLKMLATRDRKIVHKSRISSPSSPTACKLRKEEDERWYQVEGGSPINYRSCRHCAFLCAEQDLMCKACGSLISDSGDEDRTDSSYCGDDSGDDDSDNSSVCGEDSIVNASKVVSPRDEQMPSLQVIVDADSEPKESEETLKECIPGHLIEDFPAVYVVPEETTGSGDDCSEEEPCESEDEDEEWETVAGALDECPPVGTQVKLCYEDDRWHIGTVIGSRGTCASIRFASGVVLTVDLDEYAVRLADYVDEDEIIGEFSDEGVSNEEPDKHQSKISEEKVENSGSQGIANAEDEAEGEEGESDDESVGSEASDESDEDNIPGMLDQAPPVGTIVKILFEDDCWRAAEILKSDGDRAYVRYHDDGDEEYVDFDENAVRPIDYVDDN